MTNLSGMVLAPMLVDLGVALAPIAWAIVALAICAWVAIVATAVRELRTGTRRATPVLTLRPADTDRVGVAVSDHLDEVA